MNGVEQLSTRSLLAFQLDQREKQSARELPNRRLRRRFARSAGAAAKGRLGNNASSLSKGSEAIPDDWFVARDETLKDRTLNYWLFKDFDETGKRERVANCGRVPVSKTGSVVAKRSPEGVASFSGYQTCGSIWGCPVCAAKIRQGRAEQIAEGLRAWLAQGNYVFAITLTMPHEFGMDLAPLFDCIMKSWEGVLSGGARRRFWEAQSVFGTIRAFDLTYGKNGWHPHLHNLIFIENTGQDKAQLEKDVREYFETRWSQSVENQGFGKVNVEKGVDVRPVKDEAGIGTYVSKVSFELTRSDKKEAKKGGLNQWQLLREARTTGDAQQIALWKEYVLASKGRRCIEWSRGLKKMLIGVDEKDDISDDELAAQATADAPLAELGENLTGYVGNNVHAKIAAMRGVERNGADGLRYVLEYELKLKVRVEWINRSIRGPTLPDGTEQPIEIRIPRIEIS